MHSNARKLVFLSRVILAITLAGSPVNIWQIRAQSAGPSFDVASVRANHSGQRVQLFNVARGGRFTATNCSVRLLIEYAFQIKRYQVSGAPDWLSSDRYDIAATAEANPEIRYMPDMVQRLLEDRLQLKYHWETKEAVGYDLVVSKPGKFRESEARECPSLLSAPSSRSGDPLDLPCGYLPNTPGHTSGRNLTSADLADALAFFIQAFVVDKTHLTGKYDIDLRWTPESVQTQPEPPETRATPLDQPTGLSIFTALREQLGLKLESAKGPVKTIVIDHVERPSEN
jgi:uncharacterized protein (TIGR03435 family)